MKAVFGLEVKINLMPSEYLIADCFSGDERAARHNHEVWGTVPHDAYYVLSLPREQDTR